MSRHSFAQPGSQRRARQGVLRFLPAAPYFARMMPWATLAAGCATGLAISLAVRWLPPGQPGAVNATIQAGFIPLILPLAFLGSDPHRDLTTSLPAPSWLTLAARLTFAFPAVALTAWLQLTLAAGGLRTGQWPQSTPAPQPAWPPLAAELTACAAAAVAAAAIVSRTRWHDLGGAVAAPATLAAAALIATLPRLLPAAVRLAVPPHSPGPFAEELWWALGLITALTGCWASRDRWRRTGRRSRSPATPESAGCPHN